MARVSAAFRLSRGRVCSGQMGRVGRARGLLLVSIVAVLAGCADKQNALAPASPQEHRISTLFWIMMIGAWIGFGVVIALLALGWVRRRRSGLPRGGEERAATTVIIVMGVVVPILVLSALFVYSDIFVVRSTAAPAPGSTSRSIEVVGRQWFWDVRYPGTKAVTANEIHIPAKTRIEVVGRTDDVIHSFWVPRLNRKIDLIPGRTNHVLLQADRTGVFRGQCAEFCGLQHAHMAFEVIAQTPARFKAWLANMAKPARPPATAEARRGQQLFASEACSGCHTIRGTNAAGKIGPDLTHLATRSTLAALTIPNTRDYLLRWVHDPQQFKEGAKMPALHLSDRDLDAVVAYLRGLK
jgi:cytochrome c oxidase subunit II